MYYTISMLIKVINIILQPIKRYTITNKETTTKCNYTIYLSSYSAKTNTERQREFRERKRNDEHFKEKEKKRKKAERLRKKETQSKQESERVRQLARERQRKRRLLKRSQVPALLQESPQNSPFKTRQSLGKALKRAHAELYPAALEKNVQL